MIGEKMYDQETETTTTWILLLLAQPRLRAGYDFSSLASAFESSSLEPPFSFSYSLLVRRYGGRAYKLLPQRIRSCLLRPGQPSVARSSTYFYYSLLVSVHATT